MKKLWAVGILIFLGIFALMIWTTTDDANPKRRQAKSVQIQTFQK